MSMAFGFGLLIALVFFVGFYCGTCSCPRRH